MFPFRSLRGRGNQRLSPYCGLPLGAQRRLDENARPCLIDRHSEKTRTPDQESEPWCLRYERLPVRHTRSPMSSAIERGLRGACDAGSTAYGIWGFGPEPGPLARLSHVPNRFGLRSLTVRRILRPAAGAPAQPFRWTSISLRHTARAQSCALPIVRPADPRSS